MNIDKSPRLISRFIQIMRWSQLCGFLGLINLCLEYAPEGQLFSLGSDLITQFTSITIVSAIILYEGLVFLAKQGKCLLAVKIYLIELFLFIAMIMMISSGLYSLGPTLLVIWLFTATIYLNRRGFFICGISALVLVVVTGLNDIYQWIPRHQAMMLEGIQMLMQYIMFVIISAVFAGRVLGDLRHAIKEKKEERDQLLVSRASIQKIADSDPLTGLVNRQAASRLFAQLQSSIDYNKQQIVMYFVDLDNFKSINDLFDHSTGDLLLITLSQRLKALATESSIVCRLGGDEYVIALVKDLDFDKDSFAQKVLSAVSKPYDLNGVRADVTASIGLVTATEKDHTFENMCKKSDMAMYKAKTSGKNDYHNYHEDLQKEYMTNLNILDGLKNALKEGLLGLNFHPKMDLSNDKVVGVEALLRWERNNPNNYSVSQLIPVIETTELIHEVGDWLLKEACKSCKEWHLEGYEIPVSVNISVKQLTRDSFIKSVETVLNKCDLDPSYLVLELPESLLINDTLGVKERISYLKELGVKLSIDGFGTGYSNMGHLTKLKVDELKLDKTFISNLENSSDSQLVVSSVIEMANELGMNVVAGGVETESESKMLSKLGCHLAQGFLWLKPVTSQKLLTILKKQSVLLA